MKGKFGHGILLLLAFLMSAASVEAVSYNRWSAFSYAVQWYNKVNRAYVYFGTLDCTNFASQCLKAGGWPYIGQYNYTSTYAWFYAPPPYYSNTWTVADEFRKFIVNSGRGRPVSVAHHPWSSYFQVGDIIQIDYGRDGKWDHTMIITRVYGDDIWVTYHGGDGNESNNELYDPLKDIISRNPTANFMGYHLYDSFQAAPKLQKQNQFKAQTLGNIKKSETIPILFREPKRASFISRSPL
jgi:hypothetical protein